MKRIAVLFILTAAAQSLIAGGFGVSLGTYSPNTGLDDNDNSIVVGLDYTKKFLAFGIKIEGLYVDSSGNYTDILGEEFGEVDIDINSILAVDFLWYPIGTTFFTQIGLNYTNVDSSNLDELDDLKITDNGIGLEIGAGITLFDKLSLQGKILYTPDAVDGNASDLFDNLDENLMGYMASLGWRF
ncbi:MAG: hypothetical protein QNK37_33990 [Acidobacteriota bacterium]|nr:hypothetical protein [Acidobacteriota bacterium]